MQNAIYSHVIALYNNSGRISYNQSCYAFIHEMIIYVRFVHILSPIVRPSHIYNTRTVQFHTDTCKHLSLNDGPTVHVCLYCGWLEIWADCLNRRPCLSMADQQAPGSHSEHLFGSAYGISEITNCRRCLLSILTVGWQESQVPPPTEPWHAGLDPTCWRGFWFNLYRTIMLFCSLSSALVTRSRLPHCVFVMRTKRLIIPHCS